LGKIDPDNELWKQRQIKEKDSALQKRIIEAFTDNEVDYARKLYLIENCIYGVDIQAIAIQISKLRFFISLIVDQKVDKNKTNFGVLPLPNLETKFVAANTLIGIEKPKSQISLFDNKEIEALEDKLKKVRHSLFSVRSPSRKRELREEDKSLREQIGALLEQHGWGNETAQQLAHWNPYDQNANADFFDVEWMFGENGFDIVIGNPPYIDSETMVKNNPQFREYLKSKFISAEGNWDIFVVFSEMGLNLCKPFGNLAFIVPNKIISAKYTSALRTIICKLSPREIIDYSYVDVFKEADVYPVVILISNQKTYDYQVKTKVMENLETVKTLNLVSSSQFISDIFWDKYFFNRDELNLIIKITVNKKLKNKFPKILGREEKYFKFINTGTIDPYKTLWGIKKTQYIKGNYNTPILIKDDLEGINITRLQQANSPKIIIAGMSLRIEAFLDEDGQYCAGKSTVIILDELQNLKTLIGILNSKLVSFWFSKYFNSLSMAGGYFNVGNNEIGLIPIPNLNCPIIAINTLVDKILAAKKAGNDTSALEREIDVLVYGLYGLTDEEILIVEGK
jgi:hypothetical protein